MTQVSAQNCHYREDVCERLEIAKDTYYKRIKFLGLQHRRDKQNRTYLDDAQFQLMLDLDSHITNTGKMEGFSIARIEDSVTLNEGSGALVNANGKVTIHGGRSLSQDIYVEPAEPTAGMDIDRLLREAAELKAREMAMPALVKRALADKMTEDDLPEDLKEKVGLARDAANPKFTPASVAEALLSQYRRR
jgi:hypothetical protein